MIALHTPKSKMKKQPMSAKLIKSFEQISPKLKKNINKSPYKTFMRLIRKPMEIVANAIGVKQISAKLKTHLCSVNPINGTLFHLEYLKSTNKQSGRNCGKTETLWDSDSCICFFSISL